MVVYSVIFDAAFLTHAFQSYRKQKSLRYVIIIFKLAFLLSMLFPVAFLVQRSYWWIALVYVGLVLVLFKAQSIDIWFLKRRLRRSPFWNQELVISITPQGLHLITANYDMMLKWSAFTKARTFEDGVLLFQGNVIFNWLPDSALTEGTRAEVESLIQTNVKDYKRL